MTQPVTPESELRRALKKLDAAIEVQQGQVNRLMAARAKARRALDLLSGETAP
jgi:hypothetical protein